MSIVQGHDFTSKVYPPGYPQRKRRNGIWVKEEKFYILKSLVNDYVPSANAYDDETGLPISEVNINEHIDGYPDVCEVNLVWQGTDTTESGATFNGVDNDTSVAYETETTRVEKSIETHPGWSNLTDAQKKQLKESFTSFTLITVIYRRIETYKKEKHYVLTENDIIGDVNIIVPPIGLKGATNGAWMYTGKNIRWTKGGTPEISETWQYDMYKWENVITPETDLTDILDNLPKS